MTGYKMKFIKANSVFNVRLYYIPVANVEDKFFLNNYMR